MGQIANQMAVELIYKFRDKLRKKRAERKSKGKKISEKEGK